MIKHLTKFTLFSLLVLSCNNSNDFENKNEKLEAITEPTPTKYSFMSDSEVEMLIQSKDPIFMSSFWIGMTEDECSEVLRYLIEKGLIFGNLYGSEDYLSRDNIKAPEFKNRRELYCYLTPNGQRIKFDVSLNFFNNGKYNYLKWIELSISNNTNLKYFEDLIELYKVKYGTPTHINENDRPPISMPCGDINKRYHFEKNNNLVQITYSSEHKQWVGDGITPNQIHITYEDKVINNEDNKKAIERMIRENQNIKQGIKNQKEESLKNI